MLLKAGNDRIRIEPSCGGRVASLVISGLELLVGEAPDPLAWGCYPMVPWAGRVRDGQFTWRDVPVKLPVRMPPHAIHGTVFDRPWRRAGGHRLEVDLGDEWPWQGTANSEFEMGEGWFQWKVKVFSRESVMPAMVGWHPWFKRQLADGSCATLAFHAEEMYRRDPEGIPSGIRVRPSSGPWDDCFTGVDFPPRIRWSNGLNLEVVSTCDHWVIFDEPEHSFCVEPQSGPPNAFNGNDFDVATPEKPFEQRMTWRWWNDSSP